jgi:endonuclease III
MRIAMVYLYVRLIVYLYANIHLMKSARIKNIIVLLEQAYGEKKWQPDRKPVECLVRTILSQHTSDINSNRAFQKLISEFPDWENLGEADTAEIAAAIRSGGLAEIKAPRIKQALRDIKERHGKIELDFLEQLPLEEAREWLKQLRGVGTKTANCVLLFSLGKPALPVDTHVYRVSARLGLIDSKASVEEAHKLLEKMVSAEDTYRFHVLMIEHGRKTCKAVRPLCRICVLGKICPSYDKFTRLESKPIPAKARMES